MTPPTPRACACGYPATHIMRVASDDGLLLVAVCDRCDDPGGDVEAEQFELFGRGDRRPLAAMPSRDSDEQPSLPLHDAPADGTKHEAA